jgi:hypothetical protein
MVDILKGNWRVTYFSGIFRPEIVLGSLVQSGFSSIFEKTETETGLEQLTDCKKPN